jgi:hypothetical protein
MTPEAVATLNLKSAVALMDITWVRQWLDTYTASGETLSTSSPASSPASNRGRKPGAAPAENRCTWKMSDDKQCKNTKSDGSTYCKIHVAKAAAIDDAAGATE